MTGANFLDKFDECQFVKEDSASWSETNDDILQLNAGKRIWKQGGGSDRRIGVIG
jgi:hypothetical protein